MYLSHHNPRADVFSGKGGPDEPTQPDSIVRTHASVAQKVAIIFAWNLSRVLQLLVRDTNLAPSEAQERIQEYRKYMAVNVSFPKHHHPISKQIDEVWHQHVLDSPDYARFCQQVFGHFVHHNPIFTEEEQAELAANYDRNTLPHLTELFGMPSEVYWLNVRRICWGEGGGGNCS